MSKKLIGENLVGLSEAAEILKISKSALSNIQKRDESFPKPLKKLDSGPVWDGLDIINYGIQSNRISEKSFPRPVLYGNSKTIMVVGRARTGKSFLISMFMDDFLLYRKMLCDDGIDKTICTIKNVVIDSDEELNPFIEFTTNFHIISKENGRRSNPDKINGEESDLTAEAELLNGIRIAYFDNEKLAVAIEKIEKLIKKIHKFEKEHNKVNFSTNSIEIFTRPSEFAKNLMKKNNLLRLEIIDTPGVSGDIEFKNALKSDVYVFVLRKENEAEAETIKKIVTEIRPFAATSSTCFIYGTGGVVTTKASFVKAQERAAAGMKHFEKLFEDLKGSLIDGDINVLHPSKFCLCFPPMDEEEIIISEELFQEAFTEKLLSSLSNDKEKELETRFLEAIKNNEQALPYVENIIKNITPDNHKGSGNYTTADFKKNGHDRVKSNDYHRISSRVIYAYSEEKLSLYKYFSKFTENDCPEIWRQDIIRYLYHILSESVTRDRGLGYGMHPWEDYPALTMIAAESILASEILDEFKNNPDKDLRYNYINALKNNGITSLSWEKVYCAGYPDMIKKLELIKEFLIGIPASNLYELVLFRYIGGLRKMAEYNIFKNFFDNEEELMEYLRSVYT